MANCGIFPSAIRGPEFAIYWFTCTTVAGGKPLK
jgi:hypothetical protein